MLNIPEIAALDSRHSILRIPPEVDVPLTPRVRHIIDTPQFQRLTQIRQLGLVALVYPGATHSRFEHSLGVFRLALILMKRLAYEPRFVDRVSPQAAELFVLTALLHDLGHFPFCHAIEDLRLPGVLSHERGIERYLKDENCEITRVIRTEWGVEPADILYLLCGEKPAFPTLLSQDETLYQLLSTILSGPVDIDKMDYLNRDSLHAGVPYGRNFDQERLLGSLCLNEAGNGIAISSKGKTAAELMVFARYVMFSEVYWHHAVRSATAMLQRLYFAVRELNGTTESDSTPEFDLRLQETSESEAQRLFAEAIPEDRPERTLYDGLFGASRRLYKQIAEFTPFTAPELYRQIARRPYAWLVQLATRLAERLSQLAGTRILPAELIIDAPPVEREVEFAADIYYAKEQRYYRFAEVSPVVRALAVEQFDDFVKRVRIFLHPKHLQALGRDSLQVKLEQVLTELL